MLSNSIEKRRIGDMLFEDLVVVDCETGSELSSYLDKRTGGEVSGDVAIIGNELKILSGNYFQSNAATPGVQNFSYKNSFLQAESVFEVEGKHEDWGIACTGSKGYCILSAYPALSAVKLSGDLTLLAANTDKKYSWSLGSGSDSEQLEISSVNTTTNIVTFKSALPAGISRSVVSSEEEMVSAFEFDDNAIYCPSDPTIGNNVIHNFYSNHAEGGSVKAIGKYTHAEGRRTTADNRYSHAEGDRSFAGRMAAHAEGQMTKAYGYYSHAEGQSTYVANDAPAGHAEGTQTSAFSGQAHAEGLQTVAKGQASHAEGYAAQATDKYTHAEGLSSYATQIAAHAEGCACSATGFGCHAEGGYYSNASGAHDGTLAHGYGTHAEGRGTKTAGTASHAEGYFCEALGSYSHAAGYRSYTNAERQWIWNGIYKSQTAPIYQLTSDAYKGTFCINPEGGISGFYIGSNDFSQCVLSAIRGMSDDQKTALKAALGLA